MEVQGVGIGVNQNAQVDTWGSLILSHVRFATNTHPLGNYLAPASPPC